MFSLLFHHSSCLLSYFFFFNDTATTEIYTLTLHDALPILLDGPQELGLFRSTQGGGGAVNVDDNIERPYSQELSTHLERDRKSTRLNSSHSQISYAVFCLKKKKKKKYKKKNR